MKSEHSYSYIELICTMVIALLIFSCAVVPGVKNVTNKFNKTADVLIAKNIYDSLTYALVLDNIAYPDKEMYIVVTDREEINSSLDKGYKYNVLSYLESHLSSYPSKTKLNKENYVIHITPDGIITILSGTQFGSVIYPQGNGEYANDI